MPDKSMKQRFTDNELVLCVNLRLARSVNRGEFSIKETLSNAGVADGLAAQA